MIVVTLPPSRSWRTSDLEDVVDLIGLEAQLGRAVAVDGAEVLEISDAGAEEHDLLDRESTYRPVDRRPVCRRCAKAKREVRISADARAIGAGRMDCPFNAACDAPSVGKFQFGSPGFLPHDVRKSSAVVIGRATPVSSIRRPAKRKRSKSRVRPA